MYTVKTMSLSTTSISILSPVDGNDVEIDFSGDRAVSASNHRSNRYAIE